MPIARVELPDGRVARLEVPEGTTPVQVEAFIHEQLNARAVPAKGTPAAPAASPANPYLDKPTKIERFGRGFADIAQGGKQGYLMLKDWATGGNEADAYTKDKSEELALYERGRGKDAGIDWMRLGGNVVGTLPAALVPGGMSASLMARIGSGAAGGGIASGAMFTPEGESKTAQIATGVALGGAIPPAATALKSGVKKVADWIRPSVSSSVPAQRIAGELEIKLQQQGVDWKSLTAEVQKSLLDDAQRTLGAGGTLDDLMLSRKALIESVGAQPTRASVTRAPRDWQTEKNLRGVEGVGEPIVLREQQNAAAMIDYLAKLRQGTGGKSTSALEAGESAIGAIKAQDEAKETAVRAFYDAFEKSGAKEAMVPEAKLTAALTKVIDEVGQENIPAAVQARLKDFGFLGGQRTRYLNVQQADLFNRMLNANNPGHGPQSKTIGMLKSALNESLLDVPVEGRAGVEALKTARQAAAERFAEQRAGKGIAAAIDDVSPDRFVQRFVAGADARDLKAMLAELGKSSQGQQALRDVKGHLVDTLLLKATGATNTDDVAGRAFSGVRFGKALDAIEPEKLHALFTPAELSALRNLQKASKLLTEEVAFSDVNHSKTTAALANLLMKLGSTPLLGHLAAPIVGTAQFSMNWVKDANARKQVAEIIIGSAAKGGERAKLPPGRFEKLAPSPAAVSQREFGERPND